ncbi:MAG: diaminopimelate epimerase [Acidobacteriota bacterium]|nr:diaminopimelate epimerase [Acidobacteriota bacterium]
MKFIKFHGYGNDYLIVDADELRGTSPLAEFARRACDRHFGAGADGVAVVERMTNGVDERATADFRVRIFNPDGSEAAMSGNGTRCAASALFYEGVWSREELRLSTRAGIKVYRLLAGDHVRGRFRFAAEIGRPKFESASVPIKTDEPLMRVIDHPLEVAPGETVRVTALEMCNPNCCLFVPDFERVDWRRLGRLIESHARFPERTNVEFVRVVSRERIEVRIWERGVGETLSSGTGASAAAVAACVNGLTDRHVAVETPGGGLEVEWRERDGEVVLTGEAEVVYRGEWLRESMNDE